MRPRSVDDDDLLDLLLGAFADLGYDGTSVRAICRHLNVSHNLVHQRYRSKEAAWYAAVDHGFRSLLDSLNSPDEASDQWEHLRTLMVRFADATLEKPALARIIQQEASRPGPRFDYLFRTYIGELQAQTTASLLELQDAGLARPGPIDLVWFFGVAWGIGGLASSQRLANDAGRGGDVREATMLAIDVLLDGLRTKEP
jgi:TetR/AcrR family transcriptional regulator